MVDLCINNTKEGNPYRILSDTLMMLIGKVDMIEPVSRTGQETGYHYYPVIFIQIKHGIFC